MTYIKMEALMFLKIMLASLLVNQSFVWLKFTVFVIK